MTPRQWTLLGYAAGVSMVVLGLSWSAARVAAHQSITFAVVTVACALFVVAGFRQRGHRLERQHGIDMGRQDRRDMGKVFRLEAPPSNERVQQAVELHLGARPWSRTPGLTTSLTSAILYAIVAWQAVSSIPAGHQDGRILVAAAAVLFVGTMIPVLLHQRRVHQLLLARYG